MRANNLPQDPSNSGEAIHGLVALTVVNVNMGVNHALRWNKNESRLRHALCRVDDIGAAGSRYDDVDCDHQQAIRYQKAARSEEQGSHMICPYLGRCRASIIWTRAWKILLCLGSHHGDDHCLFWLGSGGVPQAYAKKL